MAAAASRMSVRCGETNRPPLRLDGGKRARHGDDVPRLAERGDVRRPDVEVAQQLVALRMLLDPAAEILPARVDAVEERPREPRAAGFASRELLQRTSRVVAPALVDERERRDDGSLLACAGAEVQGRDTEKWSRAIVALARDEAGGRPDPRARAAGRGRRTPRPPRSPRTPVPRRFRSRARRGSRPGR
jgi:hypothetical protein